MRPSPHPSTSLPSSPTLQVQAQRPIVLIAETFGGTQGGAEIYMSRLVPFLARAGHPVRVFVRSPCLVSVPDNVRIEVVPVIRRLHMLWEARFAHCVLQRLGTRGEVILSTLPLPGISHYQPHSGLYRAAFDAMYRAMSPGASRRVYSWGNGLNLRRHSLVKIQERLLARTPAPQVMTFSRTFRAQLLDAFPSLEPRVVTVPLGVDLEQFYPGPEVSNPWNAGNLERKPGKLILLFAGHNFRLKGLGPLLDAFREAIGQGLDAELLIVGNKRGQNRAFVVRVGLLGLDSRVRFLGSVADREMPRLYRSCDALIHPTFSDHCSLVVLEALASGLPVITTKQNGAAELMENAKHGFILDRGDDIPALTHALLQLRDPDRLSTMRAAAVDLRPKIDFAVHARQTMAWLAGGCGAPC